MGEQTIDRAVPQAFIDAVASRAAAQGLEAALAEAFVTAVLRRLPANLVGDADPEAAADSVSALLVQVAASAGPTISVRAGTTALNPAGSAVTVVQVHGLDRPFMLSTVTSTLRELGHGALRTIHPIIGVERASDGRLMSIIPARTAMNREAIIHVELDRALDDEAATELHDELTAAFADLTLATDDYHLLRKNVLELAANVKSGVLSPRTDVELRDEVAELLTWFDGNLIMLGGRSYDVAGSKLTLRPGSGLGVLREGRDAAEMPRTLDLLPEDQLERLLAPQVVRVSRSGDRARVLRRAPLDTIVVLERDSTNRVVGVTRIVGLFTRGALAQPARTTPVLRRRLARLLEAEDVVPGSHDHQLLIEVFEGIPRDELFGVDHDELRRMVVELVSARQRQDVRVVLLENPAASTLSIVATIPQFRYEPRVREAFTTLLKDRLTTEEGTPEIDVDVSLAADQEVLVRFAVRLPDGEPAVVPSAQELGVELRRLTRSWVDSASRALQERVGEANAHRLTQQVLMRLPASYRETTSVDEAVDDVLAIDAQEHDVDVRIVADDGEGRIRTLVRGRRLILSDFLPLLEDLGLAVLDEQPHHLSSVSGEPELHLHDFGVRGLPDELDVPTQVRVADALRAAWSGTTSSDSLHRLVLSAGLTWREVAVLRTYRRYRIQVGTTYTPSYVNDAMAANPAVVRAIVDLFTARFRPANDDVAEATKEEVAAARDVALAACDEVARLDHDRILRGIIALIDATLRTNAFQGISEVIVLKVDPTLVPNMPAPVPHREIFVLGPRVEGIHLRGGAVARGGLRWSDRQDDVRTEVLGLMKAQVLKNSVIVPTGAKGGFVLRQPPADRDELRNEVQAQYEVFIEALLSVTDDLDGDTVVPPKRVRRWDGDDPYLVVAADKGTATFSDVANGIAQRHGFWLDDAFASGGSKGYDHKVLGITARGAWVSVRRHLLELGVHPEQEPVTAAGVGDMSGDVFGNGMLSSSTLRVIAAFDHRDIFLDPNPDPKVSFVERKRLFDLPRSSWQDYDTALLSPGGMIVSRSVKNITLTDEVRESLGIDAAEMSPAELMSAILRAQVDLLWFGGIGTYIKSADESHADVGDRANDELRVDADDVRARVIGEGANLSITQRARIRYARRGGRIDQDAIHNVGGVDCSDHEVNVKILLQAARREGLIDDAERDQLLEDVTEDVVADVLRDVDLQVWRISRDLREGPDRLVDVALLMELLEDHNGLDRDVQVLPSTDELRTRREAGAGLTRPELATLLGAAKRRLKDELLATDLTDTKALQGVLEVYIPDTLRTRFSDQLQRHRLRRELVATRAANELVDRMGPTFSSRVAAEVDVDEATVAAAWWVARDVTGVDPVWRQIETLLDEVGPERQDAMAFELEVLLGSVTRRYAGETGIESPDALIARDAPAVAAYRDALFELGTATQRRHRVARAERLRDDLVPSDLAEIIACTRDVALGPEVAETLRSLGWGPEQAPLVGDVLLHLIETLGLDRLHRVLERMTTTTVWRRRLRRSLAADLRTLAARAAHIALTDQTTDLLADGGTVALRFASRRSVALDRSRRTITGVEQDVQAGLDGVTVALRTLRNAVEGGV